MKIDRFEDIVVWQRAGKLAVLVYESFSKNNDYSFRDQIRRAAVSIMNNIAEGFERKSNVEFARFLFISKGSCGEVRSMLYIAYKLNYISSSEFNLLRQETTEISKMLSGLIKTL